MGMSRVRELLPRIRRLAVRQSHAAAILAGSAIAVSGIAEWSEPIARIVAGLLVIVFFGIEFGRRA